MSTKIKCKKSSGSEDRCLSRLVRRFGNPRTLTRRDRHVEDQAQRELLSQMHIFIDQGINGPNPWWKRRLLKWALKELTPCWHWDRLPRLPNVADEPRGKARPHSP